MLWISIPYDQLMCISASGYWPSCIIFEEMSMQALGPLFSQFVCFSVVEL